MKEFSSLGATPPPAQAPSGRSSRRAGVSSVIPERYHLVMAMTLRLTDDDEKILAELAREEGISRQEATVRAIREAAARRGHEKAVQDLSLRARTRYADLLDRLAQ